MKFETDSPWPAQINPPRAFIARMKMGFGEMSHNNGRIGRRNPHIFKVLILPVLSDILPHKGIARILVIEPAILTKVKVR